jgi:hypothetical protein
LEPTYATLVIPVILAKAGIHLVILAKAGIHFVYALHRRAQIRHSPPLAIDPPKLIALRKLATYAVLGMVPAAAKNPDLYSRLFARRAISVSLIAQDERLRV